MVLIILNSITQQDERNYQNLLVNINQMQKPKDKLTTLQIEEKEKAEKQKQKQKTCSHNWYEVPGATMLTTFNCHYCKETKYA